MYHVRSDEKNEGLLPAPSLYYFLHSRVNEVLFDSATRMKIN